MSLWNTQPVMQTWMTDVSAGQVVVTGPVTSLRPTEFDFLATGKQAVFKMVPPSPPVSFFHLPCKLSETPVGTEDDLRRKST